MTEYADIPDVNTLHSQREIVTNAITLIDNGGNVVNLTVSPVAGATPSASTMPASVYMPPPTPQATIDNIRAWLVTRQSDIDAQLAALGVVNPPPAAASAARSQGASP